MTMNERLQLDAWGLERKQHIAKRTLGGSNTAADSTAL